MTKLRVKLLAYNGADEKFYTEGKEKFSHLIDPQCVEFVDEHPDVLFFLSGGSERAASEIMEQGKFYTLIAFNEGNSYAAATEVKAYYNQHGISSVLLDYKDRSTLHFIRNLYEVANGVRQLQGQNVGLIGTVSDWLIASSIESSLLQAKLGINLKHIPWESLPLYKEKQATENFLQAFQYDDASALEETGKVYSLLKECIQQEQLNAITVECFSLVTAHAVTACLPLAKFNAEGIPSGCEGDLVSIVGMMLSKEVTGIVPWIVNTVQITDDVSLFAHCTINTSLLSDYRITTHFETGKGTAIQGDFAADEITLFRVNNTLDKAFIAPGKVVKRPRYETACRTQVEVKLPVSAVQSLKVNPLGNHHLILPGDQTEKLSLACYMLGMELQ